MTINRSTVRILQHDLIPLIDVVFQLVLFFLVSTTFAGASGISVKLPESSGTSAASVGGMVISVESDGTLRLDGGYITDGDLNAALSSYSTGARAKSDFPVQLEADTRSANGVVVSVLDTLRKNGFMTVNLRTKE
jgi:biopolymer transport protein ExbD